MKFLHRNDCPGWARISHKRAVYSVELLPALDTHDIGSHFQDIVKAAPGMLQHQPDLFQRALT